MYEPCFAWPGKAAKCQENCEGHIPCGGIEGDTFEVIVTVEKRGRTRAVKLAEKCFLPRRGWRPPWGMPTKQFKILAGLKRLNCEKNLGLHILPTIRLRKIKGKKPTLILTRYNELSLRSLSEKQWARVVARRGREEQILENEGYSITRDAWHLIKDPFTGKPTFYIADFGQITKIRKRK